MFKQIEKIYTFLVVYETKSFSKASESLKISQPAVTQKIKQLEEYLGTKLIERKKNGIILTQKGKYFLEIAKNLQNCINNVSGKIKYFKEESLPFILGATTTIGTYILPKYIPYLRELINKNINIVIKDTQNLIQQLKEGKVDLIITPITTFDEEIDYKRWKKDKVVFFSNKPLPKEIEFEELQNYQFICRENESLLRQEITKKLKQHNKNCELLNIKSYLDNSTALKFTILNSKEQFVSMASYSLVKDDVENGKLFITKIKGIDLFRTIYIASLKGKKGNVIESVEKYLLSTSFYS